MVKAPNDNFAKQDHPKIISIINHIGALNLGDASILYMTISILSRTFDPDETYVLSFNPANDRHLIDLLQNQKVKFLQSPTDTSQTNRMKLLFKMLAVLAHSIFIRLTKDGSKVNSYADSSLHALNKSDLVVVCGSDMLADSYGSLALMLQIYNILLALMLKKKVIILGTTIGPIRKAFLRKISFYFLKKLDLIVVRDKRSITELRQEGMDETKIRFIPDTAFDLPVEPDKKYDNFFDDSELNYIGIGASALAPKYVGHDKLTTMLANLCDHLVTEHKSKIIFIAHVLASVGNDEEYARDIFAKMKHKEKAMIVHEFNPMKIKYVISKLDLLVSFRMHPMIHALSTGVPVIGIDYNEKTRALLQIFDRERWVISINSIDGLPDLVDQFFAMEHRDGTSATAKQPITVSREYILLLEEFVRGKMKEQ